MPADGAPVATHLPASPPARALRRLAGVGLIACLCAGLALFARYSLRDNLWPRNAGTVAQGEVYRSGRLTPAATHTLADRFGLRTIIDLGAYRDDPSRERLAQRTAEALGARRVTFQDLEGDGVGNPQSYVRALRLMADPAAQPVLVHCSAGSERTSVASMLYLRLTRGVAFDDSYSSQAIDHKHRPARNPRLRLYLDRWGDMIVEAARTGRDLTVPPEQWHQLPG